jgi:inorganic pyrophosphatase
MKRETFKNKAKLQLEEISKDIEQLKHKMKESSEDLKETYKKQIKNFEEKKEILESKLKQMADLADDKWDDAKDAFEEIANSIKEKVTKILKK